MVGGGRWGERGEEGTKCTKKGNRMLRLPSPLPEHLERVVHDTIGCCIEVHRVLGPGLLESIYSKAVAVELRSAGIAFEREKRFPVLYRGELLCEQQLDVVVAKEIILEIKSVTLLADVHHKAIAPLYEAVRLRAGLLIN